MSLEPVPEHLSEKISPMEQVLRKCRTGSSAAWVKIRRTEPVSWSCGTGSVPVFFLPGVVSFRFETYGLLYNDH